ncbi:MAG: SRPBCC family protein [Bacteroidetes bacterium]|nr:SRPBCC family protein [Bacteroidota bacterium]MBP6428195.1 SRPBCC family protein [Bacteroidia bacterium]MBP6658529.1 SRPBCC family protein [Bacteroidia bacterium]
MEATKIQVQANVAADKQKAWDFYTKPEHIVKWNFASDDWQCPRATNDMRVGGKYSARMEAKDGSFGFDFEAVYDQIVPGEKFQYTMPDGRVVNVEFEKNGNSTNVKVLFDAESVNSLELQKGGWQTILDNYKKYAEKN